MLGHDVRNSIHGLNMLVDAMTASGVEPSAVAEHRAAMKDSVRALSDELTTFTDWGRSHAGESVPRRATQVAVGPVARHAVTAQASLARSKRVELGCDVPDDLLAIADPHQLRAIVRNLVSNAVKFTNPDGRVAVTARQTPSGGCELRVSDDGIGMDEVTVARLLCGQPARPQPPGIRTGLGWPMSLSFIRANGGECTIDSRLGVGTTVTLRFASIAGSAELQRSAPEMRADLQDVRRLA